MVFANIEYLFLLLLLIPYIVWYIMKRKNSEATLQISDARVYAHTPKSYKNYLLHAPFALRIIALALIIIVLSRPQTTDSWQNSEIEGIDKMLAIDVSTSMLAEDLKPNRLEAAKDVAAEFINGRPNDNVGITLFAREFYAVSADGRPCRSAEFDKRRKVLSYRVLYGSWNGYCQCGYPTERQ